MRLGMAVQQGYTSDHSYSFFLCDFPGYYGGYCRLRSVTTWSVHYPLHEIITDFVIFLTAI